MYVIIETEDGLTIERQPAGMTAHQVAADHCGVLADEGPYDSYEDAHEALLVLQEEDFDESEAERQSSPTDSISSLASRSSGGYPVQKLSEFRCDSHGFFGNRMRLF